MGQRDKKVFINHLAFSSLLPIIRFAYGFLLLVILSKYLSPSDYGKWSLFMSVMGLILLFSSLNLMYSCQILFSEIDADQQKKDIFSISIFKLLFTLFICILFSTYLYVRDIFELQMLILLFVVLIFRTLNDLIFGFLRALLLIHSQVLFLFIESFLVIAFIFLCSFIFKLGLREEVVAFLGAEILASIFGIYFLRNYICMSRFSLKSLIKYLTIGLPLFPFTFSDLIVNSLTPFFIKVYGTFEMVAYYSIAQKVALVSIIPMSMVGNIYGQYLKKSQIKSGFQGVSSTFKKFIGIYLLSMTPVFTVLFFGGKKFIILISKPEYAISYSLMIVLIIVNIIIGISSLLTTVFAVYNKTLKVGVIWIFVLCLYIGLSRMLIPTYKLMGVGYSLISSFGSGLMVIFIYLMFSYKYWDK